MRYKQPSGIEWMAWLFSSLLGVALTSWHIYDATEDFLTLKRKRLNGRRKILALARIRAGWVRFTVKSLSASLLYSLWADRRDLARAPTHRVGMIITIMIMLLNIETIAEVSDRARLRSGEWQERRDD